MGYAVTLYPFRVEKELLQSRLATLDADLLIVIRGVGIPRAWLEQVSCPRLLWYMEYITGHDAHTFAANGN
jgi:hypothetical protein